MSGNGPFDAASRFAHLGLGARVEAEPAFDGIDWYDAYGARHAGDGAEGRLVALHAFAESWSSWEMHPVGDELVLCTVGAITLIQQMTDGSEHSIPLTKGEYAINPAGIWHTADIDSPAEALFITAGEGTQHKPR